jgi:hypothetical protein
MFTGVSSLAAPCPPLPTALNNPTSSPWYSSQGRLSNRERHSALVPMQRRRPRRRKPRISWLSTPRFNGLAMRLLNSSRHDQLVYSATFVAHTYVASRHSSKAYRRAARQAREADPGASPSLAQMHVSSHLPRHGIPLGLEIPTCLMRS